MASDLDSSFADSTRKLSKATKKAKESDLSVVDGANHGVSMLNEERNYVLAKAFLKQYGD